MSCKDRQLAAVAYYDFGELRTCTHAESFSDFRSISEPTCYFGLLYTVFKISSISYPYQCLFAPKAWDGKNIYILVGPHGNSGQNLTFESHTSSTIKACLATIIKECGKWDEVYWGLHYLFIRYGFTASSPDSEVIENLSDVTVRSLNDTLHCGWRHF